MNTLEIELIDSNSFYNNYKGHKIEHLSTLLHNLRKIKPNKNYIYLAGDSSLDNKFWINNNIKEPAINDYQNFLSPALMKPDVCYHINKLLNETSYYCINTAVEESTINCRKNNLLEQDTFIKQNITNNDILIVSIGGNDIALRPTFMTICNMIMLISMNSIENIKQGPSVSYGMPYFINMFNNEIKDYILKIIGDKRPKKIIICMIYYPDEHLGGSWADKTLGSLGYNKDPEKLQTIIAQIFKHGICNIKILGSQVIHFPLFEVLDGKDKNDYIERVEPSIVGGFKMAEAFVNICK